MQQQEKLRKEEKQKLELERLKGVMKSRDKTERTRVQDDSRTPVMRVNLANSKTDIAYGYIKKDCVFRVTGEEGGQFLFQAIDKDMQRNREGGRVRGASTISQQVAKNLYLWSGRSYIRKALEAYFTVLIESCWPKRRILEVYLNIAEFGYGIYGAEAAAQHFFHKPAVRLTRSDAALLAAVLPSPEHYSAAAPSAYLQRRREQILAQMQALGGPEMLQEIDAYPNRRP